MEIAATFVIALVGWGWAIFQHMASRKREEPGFVFEMQRDEKRATRYFGEVTVRNRSPNDIYVRFLALNEPDLPMKIDDGGPIWSLDDAPDNRHYRSGTELAVDKRIVPYTGGTPDFPSASFSFWVDDVPADCPSLSIIIKIAPALDSTTFASFKRTWSIHKPNR